ncbi:MAG: recombinase family protein, partial [Actinobacteria bacterium]|nr:recombinase family protein [Actinomycetota bacterium]
MSAPQIYTGEIEAYCSYRKIQLGEVFSDIDFSGRKGAKPRPGLEALLERRTEFESIVIPKLSRFGRSMSDLARLFDLFETDGIALVFLDLNIDTGTSQGRLLRNVMASFAEFESDVRSDYSRAAHSYLARNGRPSSGQPPYGYRYDLDVKTFTINKPEAKIVRELFTRYLAGESVNSIARDLNRRHVRTSRDAVWSHRTLLQMIENPSYAGHRRYDGELVRATWEPLVPLETHEDAKRLRRATKLANGVPPRAGMGMYLLSGLIVCGVCGKNLHHSPEKRLSPALY